jgi:nucleotide-binding universal stress UspA family protein
MYKSLFVPYSTHGDQTPALGFASLLADTFSATAHVSFASKSVDWISAEENVRVQEMFRKQGYVAAMDLAEKLYASQFEERVALARRSFEDFTRKTGAKQLVWSKHQNLYDPGERQMREECGFHDLTVMSSTLSDTMASHVINAALFGTGRPLAIIRNRLSAGSLRELVVLLAWKNTPQALRAQWFSLPLLKAAKKVVVAHAVEDNSEPKDFERVAHYLEAHGIEVEPKILFGPQKPEAAIEKAYAEAGAELLVMGAYSHARWRETVLGGFTRHFLQDAHVNLLMAH